MKIHSVFIDAQNLYHSAKHLYNARVNFKEVLKSAVNGRNLVRAIIYVIKTESKEEEGFFEALKHAGFEIRSKDIQIFPDGSKKADWDVGIAVDAVSAADKLDVAVLVTGDGDFVSLLNYLRYRGVRAEVAAFGRSTAAKLKQKAHEFYDLEENVQKYLIK